MSDIDVGSEWVDKETGLEFTVIKSKGFDIEIDLGCGRKASYAPKTFLNCFMPKEQGRKDDSAKIRYSLLPVGTVNQVVQVLEYGASTKYEINNWQKVPSARTRYYDAAMRYIDACFNGDLKDDETGLPHLAHAICCLMFLMWFDDEQ